MNTSNNEMSITLTKTGPLQESLKETYDRDSKELDKILKWSASANSKKPRNGNDRKEIRRKINFTSFSFH
jgi:hypothetical protein